MIVNVNFFDATTTHLKHLELGRLLLQLPRKLIRIGALCENRCVRARQRR